MSEINVYNVSVRYGDHLAVKGISFRADAGSIIGFIGPNGSGKTSTIRAMLGLVGIDSGKIEIFGEDITKLTGYKKKIGYVPEANSIFEALTGREYLQYSGMLYGVDGNTISKRIDRLAQSFKLEESLDKRASSYSKGMKQKIIIISALLHESDILFLDEPLDGLDAEAILVFKQILLRKAQAGCIVFYSSHLMGFVEELSSRIIVLKDGEIVADGPLGTIKQTVGVDSGLASVFQKLTGTLDPETEADSYMRLFI